MTTTVLARRSREYFFRLRTRHNRAQNTPIPHSTIYIYGLREHAENIDEYWRIVVSIMSQGRNTDPLMLR